MKQRTNYKSVSIGVGETLSGRDENFDGALVGGDSLDAYSFAQIVRSA